MKHLKSYKIFESNLDDTYYDVESIFDSLRDYGYDIYVDKEELQLDNYVEETIAFHIGKNNDNSSLASTSGDPFVIEGESEEINELKDCILRVKDFLSDWTCYMEIRYDKERFISINKDVKIENDSFFEVSDNKLVDFPIIRLKVFFIKKIKNI